MSARDDYPRMADWETVTNNDYMRSLCSELGAALDEIDVLRSDLGLDRRPSFDPQVARDAAADSAYPTCRGGHEGAR